MRISIYKAKQFCFLLVFFLSNFFIGVYKKKHRGQRDRTERRKGTDIVRVGERDSMRRRGRDGVRRRERDSMRRRGTGLRGRR